MKLPKLNKANLCTAVQIGYHVMFLGTTGTLGSHYLDEYRKAEKVLIQQMDRAEKMVDTAKETGDNIGKSVKTVESELKKVRKSCEKFL